MDPLTTDTRQTATRPRPAGRLAGLAAGMAGGVAGGLVVAAVLLVLPVQPDGRRSSGAQVPGTEPSPTPALDHLDRFRCPQGLERQVLLGGQEDGFDRRGSEPSRIPPQVADRPFYRDLAARRPLVQQLGDYDAAGPDRVVMDHVTVPRTVVSGEVVLRSRAAAGGSGNDYLTLLPIRSGSPVERLRSGHYSLRLDDPAWQTVGNPAAGVRSAPLAAVRGSMAGGPATLLDELASAGADAEVMVAVQDDTAVDMLALALCLEPAVPQGLTFVEHPAKPAGPDISVLSCVSDDTERLCGPQQGDTPCSTSLPLACYREGAQPKPANLTALGLDEARFIPGEVRMTAAVRGDSLATREAADALCARTLGTGFRVLRYQEAGGAVVISRSAVPARTRAWIEIGDQPRATCWSRPARGAFVRPAPGGGGPPDRRGPR